MKLSFLKALHVCWQFFYAAGRLFFASVDWQKSENVCSVDNVRKRFCRIFNSINLNVLYLYCKPQRPPDKRRHRILGKFRKHFYAEFNFSRLFFFRKFVKVLEFFIKVSRCQTHAATWAPFQLKIHADSVAFNFLCHQFSNGNDGKTCELSLPHCMNLVNMKNKYGTALKVERVV